MPKIVEKPKSTLNLRVTAKRRESLDNYCKVTGFTLSQALNILVDEGIQAICESMENNIKMFDVYERETGEDMSKEKERNKKVLDAFGYKSEVKE